MLNKLDEIEALIERSDEHLTWLQRHIPHINEDAISRNRDLNVIALEDSYDLAVTRIRIIIGEFANGLRSALDYIACIMVDQDSGKVTNRIQFPIEDTPDFFKYRSSVLLKGLRKEHFTFFERYQPYKAGNWIALLRDFPNFYKHTGLIILNKKLRQTAVLTAAPNAKTTTDRIFGPYPDNMHVQRGLAFTVSLPDGSNIVPQLEEIARRVRQVVHEFKPLLNFV